jgi:hypothetical protein
MASHGQDSSKIDATVKFGKKQLETLDQKTFSDILAEVIDAQNVGFHRLTAIVHYTGIGMYGSSIARTKS